MQSRVLTQQRYRISIGLLCGALCIASALAADPEPRVRYLSTPAPADSRQQHLTQTADGRLILSWVEGRKQENRLRFAIGDGMRWSPARTVVTVPGKLGAAPVLERLSDGTLAAGWMTYVDPNRDDYLVDLHLARSADDGANWRESVKLLAPPVRVYDAQLSLAALDRGKLALIWTDTRAVAAANRYQLMATVVDQEGRPGPEITVDPDVCSCCNTGMAAQGQDWVVVYRDHLAGEVRDIALARWQGGVLYRGPVHDDHWVLNGCPSNGPAVGWRGRHMAVAWFTAADGVGRVRLAFSADQGEHFDAPLELDRDANGYVSTLLLADGSAVVAWRGRAGAEEVLRVARVSAEGVVRDRTTVHQGHFPRWPSRHISLAQLDEQVFVAWTDAAAKRVRLAAVHLERHTPRAEP